MTTTPTFWGTEIIFSPDISAFGPQVAGLTDGTFVIAWETGTDLFARHLNELGSFTGGNFLSTLSANTTKDIFSPQIFEQADGRVIVNYGLEDVASPLDRDVRWHRANTDFSPNASSFGTEASAQDELLLDATARSDGVGGFGSAIAFWYTVGANTVLALRFVDAFGNQASNRIIIPDAGANDTQQNPSLAGRHTGHVVIAYENFHFDPNPALQSRDVRFHVYTPGELDVSGEVTVNAPGANAAFPEVVSLIGGSTGNFVVTWQQNGGLAFRRYFANGTALDGAPIPIAGSAGGLLPQITALRDGGFIIAWTDPDGTESDASVELDILLQRFDGAGTAIGSQVRIGGAGDDGLFGMSIATLADGRVILTYGSETGNATNITTLNYRIVDPREATINATNGADNWVGREDGSIINGLNGNDKLTGREAQDFLNGGPGDDTLRGFGGNDILTGGTERDTMSGGLGNDAYRVDRPDDVVIELAGEGTDNVNTTVSYMLAPGVSAETLRVLNPATTNAVNLTGNEIANILTGNAGANALNGRTGADTMRGLAGNDSYYVDISSDKVLESLNQGSDTVRTTVSYALAAGQSVEILRVHDQATTNALNLLGNEQVNSLMGNNGANALDGKAGADVMRGFLGNDAYYVDNAGDHVIELTNQGTDTVRTTTSFALASGMSIETLRVLDPASTNAVNLTGNQLANTVIGNNGVNVVNGGAGNDQLNAGGGNDFILFNTALSAATNVDTITAYSVAADTIRLENAVFNTLPVGVLNADAFHVGTAAADAEDRIIYNSTTGGLFYDSNGNAAGGSTQFAKLAAGLALTNSDFVGV